MTYPILEFHQMCKNSLAQIIFCQQQYDWQPAVFTSTKIPRFYLVMRTIAIVDVILLHSTVVELDLKYLLEFANCSSWMNSVYCRHLNEWAIFVSDLSLKAATHNYIPSQILNPKIEILIKVLEKQHQKDRSSPVANNCQYSPEMLHSKIVSSVNSASPEHAREAYYLLKFTI